MKILQFSRRLEPAAFRVNVFNATTELPEKVQTANNNAILLLNQNTCYCIAWPGQPLSIRLPHNLSGISSKKQRRLFALASVSILLLCSNYSTALRRGLIDGLKVGSFCVSP